MFINDVITIIQIIPIIQKNNIEVDNIICSISNIIPINLSTEVLSKKMDHNGVRYFKNEENIRQLSQFTLFQEDPYSQQISILEQKPPTTEADISYLLNKEELFLNYGLQVLVQSDSKDMKGQMTAFVSNYRLILLKQKQNILMQQKNSLREIPISIPIGYMSEIDIIKKEIIIKLKIGIALKLRPDPQELPSLYQTLLKGFMKLPFYSQCILDKEQSLSYDCQAELQRMRINLKTLVVVQNFKGLLCPSYPKYFVIPKKVDQNLLQECLKLRNLNRVPIVSYFSSQYKSTLWRSAKVKANQQNNRFNLAYLRQISRDPLIIELKEQQNFSRERDHHKTSTIAYKYLPISQLNIVFKRFVLSYAKNENFIKNIQKWYQDIHSLLVCSFIVAQNLKSGREVILVQNYALDRVSQVSALAQLIIDPYYRTISGFNILIQKQFMCFGHPFDQRLGFQSQKKQQESPIFIQFLEAISQLINTYPHCFQFSSFYLSRIGYEAYTTKYHNFYFGDGNIRKKCQPMLKTPNIWKSLPMRTDYYNYHWTQKAALVDMTRIRKNPPSVKEFLCWRQYYDMISCMKNEEPNQIQVKHKKTSLYKFINRKNSNKQ